MTINNYRSSCSDVIFFTKGEHLKFDNEYCIFGIDFSKVISYKIKETTWKNNDPVNCKVFNAEPAIAVFIILEGGEECILMRRTSNSEEILNKIINPDNKKGYRKEYSAEHDEMIPKYNEIEQVVDLKYIFDLIVYG